MDAWLVSYAVALAIILGAIAIIDVRTQRIPDVLSVALLAAGLGFQSRSGIESLALQAGFGLGVFLIFLAVRQAYLSTTGIVGLGLGDVKMAGAAAIWFSPALFPLFLLIASSSALAFLFITAPIRGPGSLSQRLPFGPFLALGVAATFILEHLLW